METGKLDMDAVDGLLPRDMVDGAFRLILGRPPESDAAIAHHRKLRDLAALRRVLLKSPEFAALYARLAAEAEATDKAPDREQTTGGPASEDLGKHADERPGTVPHLLARGILPETGPVETDIEPAFRAQLWARIEDSWHRLGERAAHWSVLTHDLFRPERLEANRQAFEDTAEVEGILVDAALERAGSPDPSGLDCLEIGCGVGRATRALAARFATVTAVDISAPHLEVAAQELAAAGIANVTLTRAARIEDYAALNPVDVAFSRLVLQHNPPPVQAAILRAVFSKLRPGGLAIFQVVTYARDYAYEVAADLARPTGAMEMHALPQSKVFSLMATGGVAPLEVQEDFATGRDGPFRSHLFIGRKT
ncbi:MAG: class I SAM-dependent methyltransferase [Pikeienuella sp.]